MHKDKEYLKILIQKCIERDLDAWDKFVKLISPLISYIIQNKLGRLGFNCQKSNIENIRQDILLSIWEKNKLETVKDKDYIIHWICALSSNATSNYIIKLKPVDSPNTIPIDDSLKGYYPLPSQELIDKDIRNDIDCALNSLNKKENLIIKLALLYGKKYREISQILNIPIGTVLVCAKRAKTKLRKKLKKYVIK